MPSSSYRQITKIVGVIAALDPQSVLDIGVGFGKYGFLVREYLEFWDGRYQYDRSSWLRRIDGIEIFEQYITPVHEYIYDNIYIGDAKDIVLDLGRRYDLVLLVDVLEHLDKVDGAALLSALLLRAGGLLISVPKRFTRQGAAFGNPHEAHRAQWDRRDFRRCWRSAFVYDPRKTIAIVGDEAVTEWKRYKRAQYRRWIKRRVEQVLPFLKAMRWIREQGGGKLPSNDRSPSGFETGKSGGSLQ